jgi:hypothetical protein
MTHSSSNLPFASRLHIGALAWVTDPTGVGIFDTSQGKRIARLSRGYVVEIIGGPEVKRYTQDSQARDIIRWQVFSPRREGDDRRPVTGWVGEGEIAAGIPTAQPTYWFQELAATWVCPDADYGTNLGNQWEVFVTQHGDQLALRDQPTIHGSTVRQRLAAGDILPMRATSAPTT